MQGEGETGPGVGAVGAGRAAGIEFSSDAVRRADSLARLSSSRSSDPGGGGADRGGITAICSFRPGEPPEGFNEDPRNTDFGEQTRC